MNGKAIYGAGRVQIDVRRFRRENVGFVFQAHNLIPFLPSSRHWTTSPWPCS
jgi:putative ABC transport system ATP-binding protein